MRHHVLVSYFTAVVAGDGRGWRARDLDLRDAEGLEELAAMMRVVAHGEDPVLALLEHEDEWFALVRVDGEDDPRVFVSDLAAASRGPFAELLAAAGDVEVRLPVRTSRPAFPTPGAGLDEAVLDADEPVEDFLDEVLWEDVDETPDELVDEAGLPAPEPPPGPAWAGDGALLEDLGVGRERLCTMAEQHGDDPAAALAQIGEDVGFAELIEALR